MWELNDLLVFDSVDRAEAFTEPPDIDVGTAYDAEGRLLVFETDGRRKYRVRLLTPKVGRRQKPTDVTIRDRAPTRWGRELASIR